MKTIWLLAEITNYEESYPLNTDHCPVTMAMLPSLPHLENEGADNPNLNIINKLQ